MYLYVTSLNSGSNGNCYYVGNETEAVLIDAGISCREIEKRMRRLNLSIKKVKSIFISHEHSDHIKGIESLSNKYRIPVYITKKTFLHARLKLEKGLVIHFKSHEHVIIGNLKITPFPKLHDACDPYSFIIEGHAIRVGVFTDIGFPCKEVKKYFKQCNAAFLEANYEEAMLENGDYPYHLKKRIRGGKGHLSNSQALDLFLEHKPDFMSHLFLSHLSEHNNKPSLVQDLFDKNANGVQIIVATRYEETALYQINGSKSKGGSKMALPPSKQLSLIFD
jgi:phosphoribosyl 1,2-cyclic phosphodiesterase